MDKEFEKKAEGLPRLNRLDPKAKIIAIERISPEFFTQPNREQKCIVKLNGKKYVARY